MAERQRTPDEIRAEIERTRADMDETVQAIGNRLSPGQIVDQMWDKVRGGDAAASFVDAVKEHPVPAMLMGLGLGWLMYERSAESEGERLRGKYGDVGAGTYARADGRVGPYRGDAVAHDDDGHGVGERISGAADRVGEAATSAGNRIAGAASSATDRVTDAASAAGSRLAGAAESVGDGLSRARHEAGERIDNLRERAGERASELRGRASELGGRARQGASRAYEEQPLALGAVAFGLGLASGLAVPSSGLEDRAVGHRSDALKDEVRRTGSEAVQGARRVAQEATQAARSAIEREGLTEELKRKARQVAEEAKNAAMDVIERDGVGDTLRERVRSIAQETRAAAMHAAEREGLDKEGLRERAREAADRVRE